MKFSAQWLIGHLEGAAEPTALAERLTTVGFNVELREPAGDDEVWDIDVTTNRPDAMNHRGLAREAAAAGCGALKPIAVEVGEDGDPIGVSASLTVEDEMGCPRYCARIVRGVTIGPSPEWMARRLERCGVRPINAVVDATNYVMLDLGQPLHAFDLATLHGAEVRVRRARTNERLTTLDGVDRILSPDDLVIADADRAIALAGVIGGADTEISAGTADVLLESAYFDALTVRRTRRRLGVATEASHRFERGADRAMARTAVDVAAKLIAELTGGRVAAGVLDSCPELPEPHRIAFSLSGFAAFVGCEIPRDRVVGILDQLELAPTVEGDAVTCAVPTHRVDLELAADLYEEVLRHFGYDNVPSSLPEVRVAPGTRLGTWPLTERARDAIAAAGLAETFSYSFVAAEAEALTTGSPLATRGDAVELANPLSARMAIMRRSLLPGLLEAVAGNLRRGAERVALGEVGRVFFAAERGVREEERIAVALAGETGAWDAARPVDFLDLKGVVEALVEQLHLGPVAWVPLADGGGVLSRSAAAAIVAGSEVLGIAGCVGETAAALMDAPSAVWVAELDLARAADAATPKFAAVPRFPAVVADVTVRHKLAVSYAELEGAIRQVSPEWLTDVAPVVVFRGRGVADDEAKTTLRLTYRHPERSLTQEEVNDVHFALLDRLAERLGVSFT